MNTFSRIFRILEQKAVLNILVAFSIVIAAISGWNQNFVFAVCLLLLTTSIVTYFGLRRAKKERLGFIESIDSLEIIFFIPNRKIEIFQRVKNKYANEKIDFRLYNTTLNKDLENFKKDLYNSSGLFIYWDEKIEDQKDVLEVIREWGQSHRANPIIVITDRSNIDVQDSEVFKEYVKDKYQIIDQEDATNGVWQLLLRSIQRGKRWVRIANFWRRISLLFAFLFFSSFIVYYFNSLENEDLSNSAYNYLIDSKRKFSEVQSTLGKVYSLNGYIKSDTVESLAREKLKVVDAISTYLKYAEEDIAHKVNSKSTVRISIWRELEDNVIYCVAPVDNTFDKLKIDNNSIIGCACENVGFALWKKNFGLDKTAFWSLTGDPIGFWNSSENRIEITKSNSELTNCQYKEEPTQLRGYKRDGLICMSVDSEQGSRNGICIDAEIDGDILQEEWIRDYILRLSVFTSIIPDEVFKD